MMSHLTLILVRRRTFKRTTLSFLNYVPNLKSFLFFFIFYFSFKGIREVEDENESLLVKLSDSHALVDALKSENSMLIDFVKSLENELKDSKESLLVRLFDSYFLLDSLKCENLLLVNKVQSLEDDLVMCKSEFSNSLGDKCMLDFDKSASVLKTTLVNKGKIAFVAPTCIDNIAPRIVDNGKGFFL